jgi:hypothetical protein
MGVLEPLVLKIWKKKIQKPELKLDPALEPEPPLARTRINPKTYLTKVSILHFLFFSFSMLKMCPTGIRQIFIV